MSLAVLIPWRGGCEHRDRALVTVFTKWEALAPVVLGTCDGPWVKAHAIRDALTRTDASRLVIADADVWVEEIEDALDRPGVVVPHLKVHRLDLDGNLEQAPYTGIVGGGIVVLDRSTYEQVPLDPRFVGWGCEDLAWGLALTTLASVTRLRWPLVHYWHPPQERPARNRGSEANEALKARYRAAHKRPADMRALLAEVTNGVTHRAQPQRRP